MDKPKSTKLRIKESALKLFVSKGIKSTTIKDIATDVSISEGALYRHFVSKEELAKELFLESFFQLADDAEKIVESHDSIDQQLTHIILHICQSYDNHPVLFNYLLITQHHQVEFVKKGDKTPMRVCLKMFQKAIEQDDSMIQDAMTCVALVFGILIQAAAFRYYQRITKTMMEDSDLFISACKRIIRQ